MSAVAAAVVAGGSIIGSVIQAGAAGHAADLQAQGAQNALTQQQSMYNQTVSNEAPFLQAGQGATSQLSYLLGTSGTPGNAPNGNTSAGGFGSLNAPFTADMMKQYSPAYQFQMQQGQQGVLNQSAGSQGALSGAALKDLTSFNQNYANTAFNNAFTQYQTQQSNTFNRLAGIAQMGQGAASNQATGGSNYASGIGQSATNIGTAQAGGVMGGANAIAGGINAATPWLYAGNQNSGTPYSYDPTQTGYVGTGGTGDAMVSGAMG